MAYQIETVDEHVEPAPESERSRRVALEMLSDENANPARCLRVTESRRYSADDEWYSVRATSVNVTTYSEDYADKLAEARNTYDAWVSTPWTE